MRFSILPFVAQFLAATVLVAQASSVPAVERGPREAIMAAADAAPAGASGVFVLPVLAAARLRGRLYLNSELDYRDQRNLTINVEPRIATELAERFGMPPERYFLGKNIRVRGTARRTRIDFLDSRQRPTGLYYYQTHVAVSDVRQIEFMNQRD